MLLDVHAVSGISDYFVICSGRSTTQVETIVEAVEAALDAAGAAPWHREGLPESGWVLLDYGDVIVHVFLPETRRFYALERLWGDAPRVPVSA